MFSAGAPLLTGDTPTALTRRTLLSVFPVSTSPVGRQSAASIRNLTLSVAADIVATQSACRQQSTDSCPKITAEIIPSWLRRSSSPTLGSSDLMR
jgi:hypothetical protein